MSQNPLCPDVQKDSVPFVAERSAFTVSEGVMNKLYKGTESDPNAPKQTSLWKEFAKQEENWRKIEKQVEYAHDVKVGTDDTSIIGLEKSLHKQGFVKCPCASGAPVLECIDDNLETPLNCNQLVRDYISCITRYRTKTIVKLAEE